MPVELISIFGVVILSFNICLVLAIGIYIFSKVFEVKEDLRYAKVMKYLPKVNCGRCGYPGCSAFAKAIIEDGVSPSKCAPIQRENIEHIRKYLQKTVNDQINFNVKKDA